MDTTLTDRPKSSNCLCSIARRSDVDTPDGDVRWAPAVTCLERRAVSEVDPLSTGESSRTTVCGATTELPESPTGADPIFHRSLGIRGMGGKA